MKIVERCAAILETTAILGPVNLAGLLVTAVVSGLLFSYRLLSQGYYRCLFSSK
jgi:hypothetical protein